MAVTLAEIITEGKELADEAGSTFVDDTQWAIWANQGARQLARLVARYNRDMCIISTTFSITPANAAPNLSLFALPTTLIAIHGVEKDPTLPSRTWIRHRSVMQKNVRDGGLSYWRDKNSIYIEPAEQSAGDYRLFYVTGQSTMTGIVNLATHLEQWWEYVALFAAIRAIEKDKLDSSAQQKHLQQMEDDDIAPLATNNNGAFGDTIADVDDLYTSYGDWDQR